MRSLEVIYRSLVSCILGIAIIASAPGAANPQTAKPPTAPEQTEFGMESNPARHPVAIPKDVLETLRAEERVQNCLEEGQSPNEIPAAWFAASRIHLGDRQEVGLVLLPNYGCLLGANTAPFWIFLRTAKGYELILDESAHDLKILRSKTNGIRDVEVYSANLRYQLVELFRFDGKEYRLSKRTETGYDQ